MVLLTMTPLIVEVLQLSLVKETKDHNHNQHEPSEEPSLVEPQVGNPISHCQIIKLSKISHTTTLESLLRGSTVYVAPPPPKPEPTTEYKALMARLRRDQEAQTYNLMLNPPLSHSHHSQQAYSSVHKPSSPHDLGDDITGATYSDIHRQVMLLFNFAVSILGVAGTIWVAARWWGLTARVLLTFAGAMVVAVAEVAVYGIYVWRMGEEKGRQEKVKEVREVVGTWKSSSSMEGDEGVDEVVLRSKEVDEGGDGVRRRKGVVDVDDD